MKGKNILISIIILLFILFISLYIGQATGYYKYYDRKDVLTNKAIKKFENDVKKGKKVDIINYLQKEKNYSNIFSRIGLKTSNLIEISFNKILIYTFKQIENEMQIKNKS